MLKVPVLAIFFTTILLFVIAKYIKARAEVKVLRTIDCREDEILKTRKKLGQNRKILFTGAKSGTKQKQQIPDQT